MRRLRALVMVGLAAIAVLATGWRLSVSSHPARAAAAPRTATLSQAGLPRALRQQLQRVLEQRFGRPARRPPAIQAPRGLPSPGACAVAGDSCSLIPCVEFAGDRTASGGAPVVLQLATPARPRGPAQRTCQGRLGQPKTLRVSGP